LRALVESWRRYLQDQVFPGGCFLATAMVEYGHRDGPVADAVRRLHREWLDLLEAELATAGAPDPQADAFRIDALLDAGNNRFQLYGDPANLDLGCRLALDVIGD
jgi:hypothetical protein